MRRRAPTWLSREMRRFSLSLALTAHFLTACAAERLPPPQPPAPRLAAPVAFPEAPPAPGTGRVVLDADGDHAKVIEVSESSATTVCPSTPCVVDLPYGSHPLVFHSTTDESRASDVDLDVGPKAKAVR